MLEGKTCSYGRSFTNSHLPIPTSEASEARTNDVRQARYRAIVWAPADNQKGTRQSQQETLYDGPDVIELRRICSHYHTLQVPERRAFYDIRYYRGRERLYDYNLPKA